MVLRVNSSTQLFVLVDVGINEVASITTSLVVNVEGSMCGVSWKLAHPTLECNHGRFFDRI